MIDDHPVTAPTDDAATAAQRRMLFALWRNAGVIDREDRLRMTEVMLGKVVETSCSLSRTDASALINALLTTGPQDLW